MIEELVLAYFQELDRALEQLSNKYEHQIVKLPSWCMCNRNIIIGKVVNKRIYALKILPQNDLDQDNVHKIAIHSNTEFQQTIAPFSADLNSLPETNLDFSICDLEMRTEDKQIDTLPAFKFDGIIQYISEDLIEKAFSSDKARNEAFNLWNCSINEPRIERSFLEHIQIIFDKFDQIIKRKAFLERRIHRFINANAKYLLPHFVNCYYEHKLYLNKEVRIADFILEREPGFPSLLIELENPTRNIFRSNGEWTAEANHAKNQICEWIQYIDENPQNSVGSMVFLKGPKQRLVVMGRGLQHEDKMINSKYSDTIMWTYEFLLKNAKQAWNNLIKEQCSLIGIDKPNTIN